MPDQIKATFWEENEIRRMFRSLLRARGYDFRKLYDQLEPQMPVVDALWICEVMHQELERRLAIQQKMIVDYVNTHATPPMILLADPRKEDTDAATDRDIQR